MSRLAYKKGKLNEERMGLVRQANTIINEYLKAGYRLTLRQLYYQFVARDLLPNTMQSYKRLGDVINEGRLLGFIDWTAIEDRTRNLQSLPTWDDPASIVASCAAQFRIDMWERQSYRVEVWVEKEALAGVVDRVATELRVPYFSCRGYVSQSEMWAAGMRLKRYVEGGQRVLLLHLGDHDPSGIDMSRDIGDRLALFMGDWACRNLTVDRIALNMSQVEEHNPPPNPAKLTDSRCASYMEKYGDESWELDALPPTVLAELIREKVLQIRNDEGWDSDAEIEALHREDLRKVADHWDDVSKYAGDL